MKLEVLQGLWATSPLAHQVQIALALERPASVWTGAADGKIIQWSLDSWSLTATPKNVLPLALLCGHTAAIVGLRECGTQHKGIISVCAEGGLCFWDSVTGRCWRRRRLPPLVLHPTVVASIPGATNYVCIGYTSSGVSADDMNSEDSGRKGGVLILDATTLTVLQNIYHGNLWMEDLIDMVVVSEELEYRVIVANSQGRVQAWSKIKLDGKSKAQKETVSSAMNSLAGTDKLNAVSLSADGRFLVLVYSSEWILKEVGGSTIVQKTDAASCLEGGCFLRDVFGQQFLVWNRDGSAVRYSLVVSVANSVSAEVVSHIPALKKHELRVRFCSMGGISVRLEFNKHATLLTLWSSSSNPAVFCGGGRFWTDASEAADLLMKVQDAAGIKRSIGTNELVTSSLVLPSGSHVPSVFVCGYGNGAIELIEFQPEDPFAAPRCLLQHTDSVLCLAVHNSQAKQVLLSGSMDGSVCLWDLSQGGKLLGVLHQHVAPVRHFVLPSPGTLTPWDQCFLSVGDDSCVALSSLSTFRTERMFPGHQGMIKEATWDEVRAYVAVLCTQAQRGCSDLLYVWDLHSGARDRILRGAAAHSMVKHFAGKRRLTPPRHQASLTSASSLLLSDHHQPDRKPSDEQHSSHYESSQKKQAVWAGCPFPGIATVQFDICSLLVEDNSDEQLLKMCLSVLHFWGVNKELDDFISSELQVFEPRHYHVAAGVVGNRGAVTLITPEKQAMLQFWRTSLEFCSLRALTMVALAHRLTAFSKPGSSICSAVAAFYSCGIFEKLGGGARTNSLEIYICFWHDSVEHLRLASRMLFRAAASKAIPDILRGDNKRSRADLVDWMESTDLQGWSTGSYHDARASRIIMSGALAAWYKTLVREDLAEVTAPLLLKLVRTSDKHSASAAEILSAAMTKTWRPLIQSEIPQLIGDVLRFICPAADMTATTASTNALNSLLPALAMADMVAYLDVLQLVVSAESSSFVLGIGALVQVIRTSPLTVVPFLGQVVSLALQVLDPGNLTRRKRSFAPVMEAIQEMTRMFPMVALYPVSHSPASKLAIGDPIGDIRSLAIQVYDLHSAAIMKVLDASGPPGHPALLSGNSSTRTQGITALTFTQDGEGVIAFSHQGLIIRWWSLGAAWWEKLSRSTVPVQCTKLVLVPPSPGFSPKSSSSSMMATLTQNAAAAAMRESQLERDEETAIDLSFRLQWKSDSAVTLFRGSEEVGTFRL